jgi:hypothetical protein
LLLARIGERRAAPAVFVGFRLEAVRLAFSIIRQRHFLRRSATGQQKGYCHGEQDSHE